MRWQPDAGAQEIHAMPLINSSKKAAFHKNIAELVRTGRPVNQAVVIAFKKKRKAQLEGK